MDQTTKFGKLLHFIQTPGRWIDEHGGNEAREGLARPFVPSIKARNPELTDEQAMEEARKLSGMAEAGGMTIGGINNIGAKAMAAGPGMAGIKEASDASKILAAGENAGTAASAEIIGKEHSLLTDLAKQMHAKNLPRWGN